NPDGTIQRARPRTGGCISGVRHLGGERFSRGERRAGAEEARTDHAAYARGMGEERRVEGSEKERINLMIIGAHMIVYSKDAEADRAFFRDVLGFASVDAGHGWLIFAMPPAETAFHPSDENDVHELYFMCEDLKAEMSALAEKGVHC